ncbi:MAG: DNA topoisomerase [Clostridia bacterium]|nr:DNA topoisomerase [Clostridia bacterium]
MPKPITKTYGDDSIISLKGPDRVRKRPGVIFGSDGIEGCQHAVFEILSNSIDEAREGHGDKIIVTRYLDHSVEIQDFGRGIPLGWNEKEGKDNWELVFCELYAGGKYKNDAGENYEFSLGLNGLGLCATQYASEFMDAEVFSGGMKWNLSFRRGELYGQVHKEPTTSRKTGTRIHWLPDLQVFTDIAIPLEYYTETLKRQAVVNSGVLFLLRNEVSRGKFEETEFFYENGITDYVRELAGENPLTPVSYAEGERRGRDREDMEDYKVKIQTAFCFSRTASAAEYYHNSSWLEHGGSPEKAVRLAFTAQIDAYVRKQGKYAKNESKITFQDVEDCLVIVTNSFSTRTSYENQTKKSITNKFIQDAMTDFLKHQLEVYFLENPNDAELIANQVLVNKRSRENAEKMRQTLKKANITTMDFTNKVEKFVDCRSRDKSVREIYIVEGDSALTSCKLARDAEFQAIIPVRGKILNCLKADLHRIFESQIITDLLKVLGCGAEVKSGKKEVSSFDLDRLNWSKVIICTDADVDGYQIRTLILTMLYRLVPTLIEKGLVYIAESPLYEINADKTYFAYTEKEKQDVLDRIKGQKFTIQRSKGLGENEPDMMWLTTMNPATRRLIRVSTDDVADMEYMFNTLLGDDLAERKEYISKNGSRYLDLTDVS